MHNILTLFTIILFSNFSYSANIETEVKKSHLEDIFIWKISDELKLTAQEERKFTEINKKLNRQKSEINRKIQGSVQSLTETDTDAVLQRHKKLIQEYNNISVSEFDSIKKLLGTKKFISYLKLKNELNSKVKSILIGEKSGDRNERRTKILPPPKVIIESK